MRMSALAEGGRIAANQVDDEIKRLEQQWQTQTTAQHTCAESLLAPEQWAGLDLFDRLQLESVLSVCQECANLSTAGRKLFGISRNRRSSANDADRLRKYLAKFGLAWGDIKNGRSG